MDILLVVVSLVETTFLHRLPSNNDSSRECSVNILNLTPRRTVDDCQVTAIHIHCLTQESHNYLDPLLMGSVTSSSMKAYLTGLWTEFLSNFPLLRTVSSTYTFSAP